MVTRYELIATDPSGKVWLAGYVRVPSRDAILRMIRQHGQEWANITKAGSVTFEGKGRLGWKAKLGAWVIRYSGRTKLEAQSSPRPFFVEAIR